MRNVLPRIHHFAEGFCFLSIMSRRVRLIFSLLLATAIFISGEFLYAEKNDASQIAGTDAVFQEAASTASALARAARNLPDADRLRTTQAALSITLLVKYGRLAPGLSPSDINSLSDILFAENPDSAEQAAAVAKFPAADTLLYDGYRLTGGNFRNIDSLIGLGGRPIALDRELPAWIVPLEPARAQALDSTTAAGYTAQQFADLQSLFDRIHNAKVGNHLVTDGLFLRPYAGRMDDLYHHLMQKEGRSGQLDYFALMDSLPPRQYSPLAGTSARQSVPQLRVSLSNVLSEGSLEAVQRFNAENPRANTPNPFRGFAVRTLPFLSELIRKTQPGSDLKISRDLMQRAMSDPRRFSPGKVPPLFLDPSRFLGQWEDPRFIRVAKKKSAPKSDLFAEIQKVDFDTPLPEMSFEPVGNALLASKPKESAPDADLLQDLGLPPQSEKKTSKYEPADVPAPVLPPPRATEIEPETPIAAATLLEKPAPPLLDLAPIQTPPLIDFAHAPTPVPSPSPSPSESEPPSAPMVAAARVLVAEKPQSTPSPEPTPLSSSKPPPLRPSAIAVIPVQDVPAASPSPSPVAPKEPQVARAIPVNPPQVSSAFAESPYQVAVLTPTATEAIEYLNKIAANDIELSNTMATLRRSDWIAKWLVEAVKPFEPLLSDNAESAEARIVEPLVIQARDELVTLSKNRETLQSALMQELKSRQAARDSLEKEIQTTRRDELVRRSGTGA